MEVKLATGSEILEGSGQYGREVSALSRCRTGVALPVSGRDAARTSRSKCPRQILQLSMLGMTTSSGRCGHKGAIAAYFRFARQGMARDGIACDRGSYAGSSSWRTRTVSNH
ncbi:uncharacterized protein MEPE_06561 [Melanopsichium pennsylvanicum]|uniref:Uncharacterized protein n=1 Tax=Melanopsichium pennsylvanicum TaxID=63383 RepID=A0AAJ4XSQ6_9BASI|nr:uncharacterized protein MEPE_06561 [Melanopsichium pennsylvanicum]